MKEEADKSHHIISKNIVNPVIKLVLFLIVVSTFLYALYAFWKFKFSKPMVEREVVSISIDDIKDVLKVAVLQIPFSEYADPTVTSLSGLLKQGVIYIERGIVTLGVDFNKMSWENIIKDDKDKTVVVTLPEIEVLSYWVDTQRSEYDIISENLLVDGTKAAANDSQRVHDWIKDRVYRNYCTEQNFKRAEISAKKTVSSFLSSLLPNWNIRIANESGGSDGYAE